MEGAHALDGGDYIVLGDGVAHWQIEGPASGRPIVLLHGESGPLREFDALVPWLTSAGFRVLRFDLFGHGLSDRLAVPDSLELFARQTLDLVAATGFPRPAIVLGHSLGAAVAATAAAARPGWFERLVLVAPMLDAVHDSAHGSAPLGDQSARYSTLRALRCELLVVAGSADAVTPPADIAQLRRLLPSHRYIEVGGADHDRLLTDPEPVAAAIRWFAERVDCSASRTAA